MKQLISFVFLFYFSVSLVAQSSQSSFGVNVSYPVNNNSLYFQYLDRSPQVGLAYNYFFNEKHGIVTELGVQKGRLLLTDLSMTPTTWRIDNYNVKNSLHYIFKYRQFFVKSGFNVQVVNVVIDIDQSTWLSNLETEELEFVPYEVVIDMDRMKIVPEFHFALGRDFDLGKINIRVNGFVEKAFWTADYMDYGISTAVFYEFGK